MRRLPPPSRVTRPPPSRTTWLTVLRTFAVAVIVMVTGAGPQLKAMTPPAATALTTAAEVQLAAAPVPTVRVGLLVSTARAADGIEACPPGLPGLGRVLGATDLDGVGVGDADFDGAADAPVDADASGKAGESAEVEAAGAATNAGSSEEGVAEWQPLSVPIPSTLSKVAARAGRIRTGRW